MDKYSPEMQAAIDGVLQAAAAKGKKPAFFHMAPPKGPEKTATPLSKDNLDKAIAFCDEQNAAATGKVVTSSWMAAIPIVPPAYPFKQENVQKPTAKSKYPAWKEPPPIVKRLPPGPPAAWWWEPTFSAHLGD